MSTLWRRPLSAVLLMAGLAGATFTSAVAADTKYKACSRLTAGEITAAVNAPVSGTRDYDFDIQSGAYKGTTVSSCTWIAGRSFVNLNIMPAAQTPAQRAEGLAGVRRQDDILRKQGYTVVPAHIAGADCNTFKPPASSSNPTPSASCAIVNKGMQFWLGIKGASATVQQAKALSDKVAARLP